jgi:hypothetical protein
MHEDLLAFTVPTGPSWLQSNSAHQPTLFGNSDCAPDFLTQNRIGLIDPNHRQPSQNAMA